MVFSKKPERLILRVPLQVLLIDPEFLDHLTANPLIFTPHPEVILKYKMTIKAFHIILDTALQDLYSHQYVYPFAAIFFFHTAKHHDQLL